MSELATLAWQSPDSWPGGWACWAIFPLLMLLMMVSVLAFVRALGSCAGRKGEILRPAYEGKKATIMTEPGL